LVIEINFIYVQQYSQKKIQTNLLSYADTLSLKLPIKELFDKSLNSNFELFEFLKVQGVSHSRFYYQTVIFLLNVHT